MSKFNLNKSKHFKCTKFDENICKLFRQGSVIFLREVIFYTQFSIVQLTKATKYQRMSTHPVKKKANKYTWRLRYITNTWRTLLQLANTKISEQHFYDRTHNRAQLHFCDPSNKHTQIQQSSNKRNWTYKQ